MTGLLFPLLFLGSTHEVSIADRDRPHLIATLRVSPVTAFPDGLGLSLVIHAIPYIDIEAGVGVGVGWLEAAAYIRGGPRLLVKDWRDEAQHGWTMRASVLGGPRHGITFVQNTLHANVAAAADWTYWVDPHFGFSVQLLGGILIPVESHQGMDYRPDVRLAVGLSF